MLALNFWTFSFFSNLSPELSLYLNTLGYVNKPFVSSESSLVCCVWDIESENLTVVDQHVWVSGVVSVTSRFISNLFSLLGECEH